MTAEKETIEQVTKLSKAGWGPMVVLGFIGVSGYLDSRTNIISKLENYQNEVTKEIKLVTTNINSLTTRIGNLETQVAVQNGFNSRIERLENNLLEISKYLKKTNNFKGSGDR